MNIDIQDLLKISEAYEQNLPEPPVVAYHPGDSLARYIDHTLLKPEATPQQIEKVCAEAREFHFASVCVNPIYVPLVNTHLHGSDVAVCSVVGFPLGAVPTETKLSEVEYCLEHGATEIDMVIPVGLMKAGEYGRVLDDIQSVVDTTHLAEGIVKVILETALLTRSEKVTACLLCQAAGADFVKTSTGFGPGGATVEDVSLMSSVVGLTMGVKASGGVRTYASAMAMIRAGATRLGSSSGVKIIQEQKMQEN